MPWYEVEPSGTADGSTDHFRPEIPFRLIGRGGNACLFGLLDTGADEVLIPRSIADDIDIAVDNHVQWSIVGFAGQASEVVLGHVEFEVEDGDEFYRWPAKVGVVDYDDPIAEPIILLGYRGFLEFFNADFRGGDRVIVLNPADVFIKQTPS